MTNRELYFRDPTTLELLNNGVSKVSEIGTDESQIRTLRFELVDLPRFRGRVRTWVSSTLRQLSPLVVDG